MGHMIIGARAINRVSVTCEDDAHGCASVMVAGSKGTAALMPWAQDAQERPIDFKINWVKSGQEIRYE